MYRGIFMGELANCPRCGKIFAKTKFCDVCQACFQKEEKLFEKVYQFIRKRENRTATIEQVIEATGVDENLIIKYIKSGRLRLAQFPNLGYKCDKCGSSIREGILCEKCSDDLRFQLKAYQEEEQRKREIEERNRTNTYLFKDQKK